jgi:hypothetical protein
VDLVVFELNGHLQSREDVLYAAGNLRTDAVPWEENDLPFVDMCGEAVEVLRELSKDLQHIY